MQGVQEILAQVKDHIDRDYDARRNPKQFPFSQQELLSAAEGADALFIDAAPSTGPTLLDHFIGDYLRLPLQRKDLLGSFRRDSLTFPANARGTAPNAGDPSRRTWLRRC